MKFKIFVFSVAIIATAYAAISKSNVSRVWIKGGGTVQKSAKWAISDLWYKGIALTMNDTSRTYSDSCGVNVVIMGFIRNSGPAGEVKDSGRVYFNAVSRLFKTAYDTTHNALNVASVQLIDSSIVISDSMTSAKLDGVMDMIQISPICCYDSIQLWFYPNALTKKASSVKAEARLNQIDTK